MNCEIQIYSQLGKKLNTVKLDSNVFCGEAVNIGLINEYYRLQLSNARRTIANTKTRGQVQGSGRKLYRQKGTGSARVGDKKSPLRKKGGVVFGPTNEKVFSFKMNKKSKKKAMAGLFFQKVLGSFVIGIDIFDIDRIKTKLAKEILAKLPVDGRVLVVLDNSRVEVVKSFANLVNIKVIDIDYLNPRDVLTYKNIIIEEKAIESLVNKLSI